MDVKFENDIPTITREGAGRRGSKYGELLDKVKEQAQNGGKPVAFLSFEKQSLATSRYTSIRDAAQAREDADHWTVATRNMSTEDEADIRVYVKWNDEPQEKKAKDEDENPEPKKVAAKKTAKKAAKKTTKKTATHK